ncbi:MFS transporter [Companilactobacillus paralimentarius]|uniref:MFS transporter n=1 Tax=Companilactobacillus paralimentarius TaxID=83526 RepID=UPI00285309E4|nr:MFS transporter [Companilactobacillus paralimentarius]MDR4934129.1 MFS transporter [Companilactobacillus paralimentarius]
MTMKKKLIILTLSVIGFLVILDTNIMNIAIPEIQSGLHVSLTDLSWAINIYTILFASFLIPFGRIGDIVGHVKLLNIALIVFAIGSTISGLASSLNVLLIGRSIQSIGAAVMLPSGMILGFRQVEKDKRNKIIAIFAATQALGAALGPTIGGFISQYFGWHWVFLINVPLVVIVLVMNLLLLSMKNEVVKKIRIDFGGTVLIAGTLFLLTLSLVEGRNWNWLSLKTIGCLVSSLLLLVIFLYHEQHSSDPIIPLKLFRNRNYVGANVVIMITFIVLASYIGIIPTFLTKVIGVSELHAALLITPMSITLLFLTPIATKLVGKVNSRILVGFGIIILSISVYLMSHLNLENNYNQLYLVDILLGLGIGSIAGPAMSIAVGRLEGTELTAAQNVLNVVRNIGMIIGIALFLSLLDGNIDSAKQNVHSYATDRIENSKLPKVVQNKMINKVKGNANTSQINSQSIKQPQISTDQTIKMAKTQTKIIIDTKSNAGIILPTEIKQQLYQKVLVTTQNKVKVINHELKGIFKDVKQYIHNQLTDAFLKLYKWELPFVVFGFLAVFIFKEKQYK